MNKSRYELSESENGWLPALASLLDLMIDPGTALETKLHFLKSIKDSMADPDATFSAFLMVKIEKVLMMEDLEISIPILECFLETWSTKLDKKERSRVEDVLLKGLTAKKPEIRLFAVKHLFNPFHLAFRKIFMEEKDITVFTAMIERVSQCELADKEFLTDLKYMIIGHNIKITFGEVIIAIGLFNLAMKKGFIGIDAIEALEYFTHNPSFLGQSAIKTLVRVAKELHAAREK